jgi:hypothetical protein
VGLQLRPTRTTPHSIINYDANRDRAVGALATLGRYEQSLQFTSAVVAGVQVVVGSDLLLAFTLKEIKCDAKLPLIKRAPVTSNSEYYTQLELNYHETL